MNTIRSFGRAAGAVGVAGALVLVATPASAEDTATVSILHAVPDTPVDVYANGERAPPRLPARHPHRPLELPAGTYDLAVYPAGSDPETTDPAISADGVEVPAGANATMVAHLGEDGTPVLTPFVNDISKIPAGEARVTVRHTAAAPAVDIRAGGTVVAPGLANPEEASLTVPAGTVSADVVLAGTDPSPSARPTSTSRKARTPSSTRGFCRRRLRARRPDDLRCALRAVRRPRRLGRPGRRRDAGSAGSSRDRSRRRRRRCPPAGPQPQLTLR